VYAKLISIVVIGSLAFLAGLPQERATDQSVSLSLIVTDKDNKGVANIRKDQVRVFEGKVEQTDFTLEPDERPIDYGIAIDGSGSVRSLLPSILETVRLIIVNRRPDDQIFIEKFVGRGNIQKHHDFSTDTNALIESLKTFKIEQGQSAVIDALYTAVQYVDEHSKANRDRRKALVIVTDGEDRNSIQTEEDLIKLLHERGVQVFVIGLLMDLDSDAGYIRKSPRERAEKLLKTVAEESGGRVFLPAKKEQLIDAAKEIILDLRAQYRIRYQLTKDPAKTGFRKVEAKFVSTDGQKRKLIVPPGYYAGAAKSEKK
jgi:Ca-activated chloride channel family protein